MSWHTLTGVRISSLGSVHVDSSIHVFAPCSISAAPGYRTHFQASLFTGGKLMPAAGLSTQTGWTLYSVSAKSRCLKIQEVGSQFLKSRHRQGANSNKFWIKGENFKERRWWPHLSARVASKDGLCFKIMEGTSSALLVLRRALVCLSSSQCWHYRCVPPCPGLASVTNCILQMRKPSVEGLHFTYWRWDFS